MPAIITHHLFGTAIKSRLGEESFAANDELAAFLLGNQGPDPLFYAAFTPRISELKKLGGVMHERSCARALDSMREFAKTLRGDAALIANAYLCGYICHYSLDSTAHPFIFGQQYAITSAGVEGLGPEAGSYVHSQIETDIDSAILKRMTGQTIAAWRVHDHVLIASNEVLEVVDKLYRYCAAGVYGVVLPAGMFTRCVKDFRTTTALLHSPTGRARDVVGRIERVMRPHSIAQALSHRTDVGDVCPWDNADHQPWTDPFTGEVSTASFDDLFERAQDIALENIALHLANRPSSEICGEKNFSGAPL